MHSFSFDIGTNSIGWAVLALDQQKEPAGVVAAGSRIYSDGREPKSGTSLAEGRRVARGMARRRDRYKRRRRALLNTLTEYGLMPDTPEARKALVAETNDKGFGAIAQDVYALRARALDERLEPFHLGRALFHLNQRRGFKSNRKTDSRDNEQGMIAAGIARLDDELAKYDARTIGEMLCKRRGDDPNDRGFVRIRPSRTTNAAGREETSYGFYPERSFLEDEFDWIRAKQAEHHPSLTGERWDHLKLVMFYQRPLKRPKVGKCSFNPEEERLPKAHPLFQQFRVVKEVNELELVLADTSKRKLTIEERDTLVKQLSTQRDALFTSLRRTIKAPYGARFNKESDSRIKLKGDEVAAELSAKTRFGQGWFALAPERRVEIALKLIDIEDPLELHAWLEAEFPLTLEQRDAIVSARLPDGYGRLGETALAEMLIELKAEVIPEAEAAKRAGYDHALQRSGDAVPELPKYQEVLARRIPPGTEEPTDPYDTRKGRITNPTIHIGLNQLQRLMNRLIGKYGRPEQISLELARELKLSEAEKDEANRKLAKNTRDAERRSGQLIELKQIDNGYNRLLLKLWEELNPDQPLARECIYCGEPIGVATLFSSAIDVDHILPWSQTLDDSQANRIVCHRECNREKGNHAPVQVHQWHDRYDAILARAQRLPQNKRWRFGRDAMERFKDDESFIARQLTDTQYLSRMAHEYLGALYDDEEPDEWGAFQRRNHVRVIPGRMTEMLRRQWGLNSLLSDHNAKNRNDHRHHAIDAIVVGVTTRSLLQRIATLAGGREALALEETIGKIDPPWPNFRGDVKAAVDRIVVSHKPDHGSLPKPGQPGRTAGQLHNDTAYGFTGEERNGVPMVVHRVPIGSLTEKDLHLVRDRDLADALHRAIAGLGGKDLAAALAGFAAGGKYKGIRHVRVIEPISVVPIRDATGRAYKGYKGDANYRYDVWELPNGKWVEDVITMFQAHRPEGAPEARRPHPAARRVLSLQQNDMVAYEHPADGYTIARLVKFSPGQVTFAGSREAGPLKSRHTDPDDRFRYFFTGAGSMRTVKLRQVRIDEIGQVFDPGPQDRASRETRKEESGKPRT